LLLTIKTRNDHPFEHLGLQEAPNEVVAKVHHQITGQVLVIDAMIRSTNITLEVRNQGMGPGKQSDCVFPQTCLGRVMEARPGVQEPIGLPTIRPGHDRCSQVSMIQ
jgi:hypothetical protein